MIDVTVAICTYDRARLLRTALDSVLAQTYPSDAREILVVDNGSTDETNAVVLEYQQRDRTIRLVSEETPGIAHARNRALREARGIYLAFLDDDATAEVTWLTELMQAREAWRQPTSAIVGPVILNWQSARPDWMRPRIESLLCAYDMGSEARVLGENGYLLTTNCLFHRQTLLDLDGFRTYLGRKRGRTLGGEDNDVYRRWRAAGLSIFYTPAARVFHDVPPERTTRLYVLRRLFWDGASQPLLALSDAVARGQTYHPLPAAYWDLRRCLRLVLDILLYLSRGNTGAVWDTFLLLMQRLGRVSMHLHCVLSPTVSDSGRVD